MPQAAVRKRLVHGTGPVHLIGAGFGPAGKQPAPRYDLPNTSFSCRATRMKVVRLDNSFSRRAPT